jgi:hypothetical protein
MMEPYHACGGSGGEFILIIYDVLAMCELFSTKQMRKWR